MSIMVVIPTYNEAENMQKLLPAILAQPLPEVKILVVDDNSPDGTGELVEELGADYPEWIAVHHREEKLGLGTAYLEGYRIALESGSDYILQMDADFSHPPEKIPALYAKLQEGFDVAVGSRYVPGGSVDVNWPLWRKSLSRFGSFYARTILGMNVRDMTGAFRLWRREALARIPLDRVVSVGYTFQVEMIYLAHKLGLKIGETPIYFADRKWGTSKMSFAIQVEAAIRTWQLLWRHRDL
jgi:dolichol-phosphate mannosyltransferase